MGLGMQEIIVIMVFALIFFGPRKLPELGKSLGQAMAQFRKASDEFKRTWEQEVELEKVRQPDTPALAASNYDGNDHNESNEPGYQAESDYHYGYDASNGTADSTAAHAAPSAVVPEAAVAAAASAPKAEAHWI